MPAEVGRHAKPSIFFLLGWEAEIQRKLAGAPRNDEGDARESRTKTPNAVQPLQWRRQGRKQITAFKTTQIKDKIRVSMQVGICYLTRWNSVELFTPFTAQRLARASSLL